MCYCSSAYSQQLQIPNDAASYDPIRDQSGLLRRTPQLTGPHDSSLNSQFTRRAVHAAAHSARWVLFLLLAPLRGEERVKGAAVSLNSAPQAWPGTARVAGCQRDKEQHRSRTCDVSGLD